MSGDWLDPQRFHSYQARFERDQLVLESLSQLLSEGGFSHDFTLDQESQVGMLFVKILGISLCVIVGMDRICMCSDQPIRVGAVDSGIPEDLEDHLVLNGWRFKTHMEFSCKTNLSLRYKVPRVLPVDYWVPSSTSYTLEFS